MKKPLLLIPVFIFFLSGIGMSCPICGCGGGNLYMGLLPDFKYQFIGLRFHTTQYHTQLISDPSQFSTNTYHTVELWGGIRLGRKFQLLAFVPYYLNKQVDDDGTKYTQGLGDITLMGQYQIFSSSKHASSRNSIIQQLWIGGGIKLPTGPFNANVLDSNTTVADINAQTGTGSVDFLINGMYSLSVRNFGVSLTANYKVNTVNADQYKYGNKFQSNLIAFYHMAGATTITPNLGMGYENVAINQLLGKSVQFTGSRIMTAIAGVEFDFGKWGTGINAQIPLAQNFAEGQTRMKFNTMMHVTYQF